MRGIIGFTGKNAVTKNILLVFFGVLIFFILIHLPPAKYESVKSTKYGFWGVKKIER